MASASSRTQRRLRLRPVGLAAPAVGLFAFSTMLQSPTVFGLSLVLVPVAFVAFVAMPLVAMRSRPEKRSRR